MAMELKIRRDRIMPIIPENISLMLYKKDSGSADNEVRIVSNKLFIRLKIIKIVATKTIIFIINVIKRYTKNLGCLRQNAKA
jgi:hypothetical protein